MIPNRLSVVVPFIQEHPQVMFTIQSIHEELEGRVDHEIIAVENWSPEIIKQGAIRDRSSELIQSKADKHSWLKFMNYGDKLSHWQAKNAAVAASDGEFLWFCDSHCVVGRDALYNMFQYYSQNHEELNGSIHLPLTYHILEEQQLIYQLVTDLPKGVIHYKFMNMLEARIKPFEVPVMSTCGMMMTRELYNQMGGWPTELGIYGGGENYINFALSVMGKKKWISPGRPLHHHGDKRGYRWNALDFLRNRLIALYITVGEDYARRYCNADTKISPFSKDRILKDVIRKCEPHRQLIQSQAVISIEDWIKEWS